MQNPELNPSRREFVMGMIGLLAANKTDKEQMPIPPLPEHKSASIGESLVDYVETLPTDEQIPFMAGVIDVLVERCNESDERLNRIETFIEQALEYFYNNPSIPDSNTQNA